MNRFARLKRLFPALALLPMMPGVLHAAAVRETVFAGDRALLERFRYVRQAVKVPDDSEHDYYAVALDGVFFETLKDAGNLRITDSDGKPVSFTLRKLTHTAVRFSEETLTGKISIAQVLPDGRTAIDYELSDGAEEISGVEVEFSGDPAAGTLEIFVGDGRRWETALPETGLAGLQGSEFTNVRNFPFVHPRRGHLLRLIFGGRLVQTESALMPVSAVRPRRMIYEAEPDAPLLTAGTLEKIEETGSQERTTLVYHSDRTPLKEFLFESDTPDFQRRTVISGSNDRRHWTELSGGSIRRIGPDRALKVEIPESRWKFYRVEILNGSAKALLSPRIRPMALQYELLIPRDNAAGRIVIYYGTNDLTQSETGEAPRIAPGETIGSYELQTPVLNPLHRYSVSEVTTYRFLGGGVILCGTLLALFHIFRALKRSEAAYPRD